MDRSSSSQAACGKVVTTPRGTIPQPGHATTLHRFRRVLAATVVAAALAAGMALPAAAITHGVPDEGAHPNVGALLHVREAADPATGETVITSLRRDCSGALIGETTFLTAAHCVAFLDTAPNPPQLYVTFDEAPPYANFPQMRERMVKVVNVSHAGYDPDRDDGDWRDLALLTLADAPSLEPVRLVAPRALDQMTRKQRDALVFTSVGYGTARTQDRGEPTIVRQAVRMKANGTLLALTRNWLTISQNQALDNGGTCSGDSGGPIFATIAGQYVVTAITSTGDAVCQATNKAYRVDSPAGQAFLADYSTD